MPKLSELAAKSILSRTGGGSSINVGNETALDLLISGNTNKTALAAALTAKGASANSSAETMPQLISKVNDLVIDTSREKVPAVWMSGNLSSDNVSPIKLVGDWVCHRYNNKIYFFKLDSFFNTDNYPRVDNYKYNFSLLESFYIDRNSSIDNGVAFNADCSKCYIYTSTALYIYSVDYVNKTSTLLKTINYAEPSSARHLSVNSDGTYALLAKAWQPQNIYVLDLSAADGATVSWSEISTGMSTGYYHICTFVGTNNIIDLFQGNGNTVAVFKHYTIDFTTMTLTEVYSDSMDYGNNDYFDINNSYPFSNLKIGNTDYVFVKGTGAYDADTQYPHLAVYNLTSHSFTKISAKAGLVSFDNGNVNRSINVQQLDNGNYSIFCGLGYLPIQFDSALNVVCKSAVGCIVDNRLQVNLRRSNCLLNSDGTIVVSITNGYFYKRKIYNNKRVLYAKTSTVNGTAKTRFYPVICSEQDIVDGYLDI